MKNQENITNMKVLFNIKNLITIKNLNIKNINIKNFYKIYLKYNRFFKFIILNILKYFFKNTVNSFYNKF